MPFKNFGTSATLQDVLRTRKDDCNTVQVLENGKLMGRFNPINNGVLRAAPSAHNNVIQGDAQGDVITDATYIYTLLSVSGTLVWNRQALSIAW